MTTVYCDGRLKESRPHNEVREACRFHTDYCLQTARSGGGLHSWHQPTHLVSVIQQGGEGNLVITTRKLSA